MRRVFRSGTWCAVTWLGLLAGCGGPPEEGPAQDVGPELAQSQEALRVVASPHSVAWDYAGRDTLIHGIAGDERLVFVTEALAGNVVVLDRFGGQEIARLPLPSSEGFILPFTLRVPYSGRLVVLDAGGFPSPVLVAVPRIYDYDYAYDASTGTFSAQLVRTVRMENLPVVFTEDLEVTSQGDYVVSESVIGGLWVIHPDGSIAPGVIPDDPSVPLPQLGPCPLVATEVDGVPFDIGFGPGVGSLAERDGYLYFGSTCLGGIQRIPLASLVDTSRTPSQRAADIQSVSPRPAGVSTESLKGLSFNRFDPSDRWLYVGDPFRLQLLRIDPETGAREVVGNDPVLFNFSVSTAFLPPVLGGRAPLLVVSDQEYRLAALNPAISEDLFEPPFLITKVLPAP